MPKNFPQNSSHHTSSTTACATMLQSSSMLAPYAGTALPGPLPPPLLRSEAHSLRHLHFHQRPVRAQIHQQPRACNSDSKLNRQYTGYQVKTLLEEADKYTDKISREMLQTPSGLRSTPQLRNVVCDFRQLNPTEPLRYGCPYAVNSPKSTSSEPSSECLDSNWTSCAPSPLPWPAISPGPTRQEPWTSSGITKSSLTRTS